MRRFDIPFIEGAWIGLPDEWLGEHAQRRDKALKAGEKYESATIQNLVVSIALLESWDGIPGMQGRPESWQLEKFSLKLIAWLNMTILRDFLNCFLFPATSSSPSPTALKASEKSPESTPETPLPTQ